MEAIVACTRDNAFAVGLEGEVGEISPGNLADLLILDQDPVADITVLSRNYPYQAAWTQVTHHPRREPS